jgi:polyphosphate kinase
MSIQQLSHHRTHPGDRFINRELSWLEFDRRVLALAEDPSTPLLERVKFLAIFSSNLDEFFQVRVSGLREQQQVGVGVATPEGMTPGEQLAAIRERCLALVERTTTLFEDDVCPALAASGVDIVNIDDLDDGEAAAVAKEFRKRIFPVLTPLSVDPAHPFPYVSSLSMNLAAVIRDPVTGVRRFARVKIPPLLPRFVALANGRFVPIEQVIAAHLDQLFPGMDIVSHGAFRVTRDADVDVEEDEADDLLAAMQSVLRRRRRSAEPVRLEVQRGLSRYSTELLMRELRLGPDDVYDSGRLLDLSALWSLYELDRPDLKDEPRTPQTQARLRAKGGTLDLFGVLRQGDVLVQHPYDSFGTVEAFVELAAEDPNVLAIKQTLYRTSTQESPIIRALIRASESGKQVVTLVELQARFDEEANITYARALEEAGVHVIYGVVGLKTHAKTTLIVRREGSKIRRYVHIGTGNYNPRTATIYEDVGLLSADPELGADLTDLFNTLSGYSRQRGYRRLVVAPHSLRSRILELIRREAVPGGRITMKMNSLVDADTIDALYAASQAGCEIDLIVRGICCLRPGVPGLSDHIRVRSLVGRYLEHSRIFRFGQVGPENDHLIGSADLMPRNLDRRVEAVVPILDPALKDRLDEILQVELEDDVLAWELDGDAQWHKVPTVRGLNAHDRLQELAVMRSVVQE